MMYLFTKKNCDKCHWLKGHVDLKSALNLQELTLEEDDAEALALLAYFECVALAEKMLPILVDEHGEIITGAIKIRNYLNERCN